MKKNKKSENLKNTYVELDVTDMTPDGNGVGARRRASWFSCPAR